MRGDKILWIALVLSVGALMLNCISLFVIPGIKNR